MLKIIESLAELKALETQWQTLWQADALSTIYTHPQWHISYIESHPQASWVVLAIYEDNDLAALWTLERQDDVLQFLSTPWADYARPSVKAGWGVDQAVEPMLKWASEQGFRQLSFNEIQQDDTLADVIADLAPRHGFSVAAEQSVACPRMDRAVDDDILVKKFIKSKNQKNVLRKLKKRGETEFTRIVEREAILVHLDELFAMHTARWAGVGETMFVDGRIRQFFRNLVEKLPEEMINFTVLRLNDVLVAFNLDFCVGDRLYMYKQTFDRELWKASLGLVNVIYTGRDLIERDFKMMDFSRGGDEWKMRLANEIKYNRNVHCFTSKISKCRHRISHWAKSHFLTDPDRRYKIKYVLTQFRAGVERHGLFGLVSYMVKKYYHDKIKVKTLLLFHMPEPVELEWHPDWHYCEAEIRDVFEIAEMETGPLKKAEYIRDLYTRFRNGDRCVKVVIDDKIACFVWNTFQDVIYFPEVHKHYKLDHEVAYTYDGRTIPWARGRGIYSQTLRALGNELLTEFKARDVYGALLNTNIISEKGVRRAGFQYIKTFTGR